MARCVAKLPPTLYLSIIILATSIAKLGLAFSTFHTDIYLVLLKQASLLHYVHDSLDESILSDFTSDISRKEAIEDYALYLIQGHDSLLEDSLGSGNYRKLYSYHYLLNGFAVSISPQQAAILSEIPEVLLVERDIGVQKLTTYTPSYLGLSLGAWSEEGGQDNAGEGIIIGVIDTGIDPQHPSFSNHTSKPYSLPSKYTGMCEVAPEFPEGSCNNKIVGARHFAKAAIDSGLFNATLDYASPLDGAGHGTHTASTAAGNNGVPVVVAGINYGLASGMAPRAHLAIYKALYKGFGGLFADVVAAIDQAVQDGVDILSLSIAPNTPPSGLSTFLNIFDIALLSAVKAGVFVAQAAGNSGPYPSTVLSFSPWICSVAAAVHDRTYTNSILLGNNRSINGVGLAPATKGEEMYPLILAVDAARSDQRAETNIIECQQSTMFNKTLVSGKLLVCYYTFRFMFGMARFKNVMATAQNLSAKGVIILTSSEVDGHSYGAVPLILPSIIIPTVNDSQTIVQYYKEANSVASARILGGTVPSFNGHGPKVASYSSRGPDVADDKLNIADVLKPNIMAPGTLIWAAWSSVGLEEADFDGEVFAMISGTSMATPHIAGIAALIKQKHPNLSPAAITSALSTTASIVDEHGNPLVAQSRSSNGSLVEGQATYSDFGAGAVNATAALDPGLVFDAGFNDYIIFLCSIPGLSDDVLNFTKVSCGSESSAGLSTDLNSPSIAIANLNATRNVPRIVTNIAEEKETYTVSVIHPQAVSVTVDPTTFTVLHSGDKQQLIITLTPTQTSSDPSYGSILLTGSQSHIVRMPIAIYSKSISSLWSPMSLQLDQGISISQSQTNI